MYFGVIRKERARSTGNQSKTETALNQPRALLPVKILELLLSQRHCLKFAKYQMIYSSVVQMCAKCIPIPPHLASFTT